MQKGKDCAMRQTFQNGWHRDFQRMGSWKSCLVAFMKEAADTRWLLNTLLWKQKCHSTPRIFSGNWVFKAFDCHLSSCCFISHSSEGFIFKRICLSFPLRIQLANTRAADFSVCTVASPNAVVCMQRVLALQAAQAKPPTLRGPTGTFQKPSSATWADTPCIYPPVI